METKKYRNEYNKTETDRPEGKSSGLKVNKYGLLKRITRVSVWLTHKGGVEEPLIKGQVMQELVS